MTSKLSRRMDELEAKFDQQFRIVFDAIRQLMAPPPAPQHHKIGFDEIGEKSTSYSPLKSRCSHIQQNRAQI